MIPAILNPIQEGNRFLVVYDPVRPEEHEIDCFDARQADRIRLLTAEQ